MRFLKTKHQYKTCLLLHTSQSENGYSETRLITRARNRAQTTYYSRFWISRRRL